MYMLRTFLIFLFVFNVLNANKSQQQSDTILSYNDEEEEVTSCCPQHDGFPEACANEGGSDCVYLADNDPIAVAAGSYCVSLKYAECKQEDINAICPPGLKFPNWSPPAPPPAGEPGSEPLECGPAPPPPPTPEPTKACEIGIGYEFEGYPCQISGDPHTKCVNGDYHDFQGQPLINNQFYYVHTCHGSDKYDMPFNILGTHYHWGTRSVSGIDYFVFELYDINGDEYYLFLSSGLHSYIKNMHGVSTQYEHNTNYNILQSNIQTQIGQRFKILYNQKTSSFMEMTLMIDDECEIKLFMQGQAGIVNGRYRMHYLQFLQSSCYKCFQCGLCGDFKKGKSSSWTKELETCNGDTTNYRPGWNEHNTPEAYDLTGWTWEKNYVQASCGTNYDNTDNNGNFVFVNPCDVAIENNVKNACQTARDNIANCCNNILGNNLCDQAKNDCDIDACAAATINGIGDINKIDDAVQDIFGKVIGDVVCNIPGIGDEFSEYIWKGCYMDTNERAIKYRGPNIGSNAPITDCMDQCKNRGDRYFAIQYNVECFCTSSLQNAIQFGQSTACNEYGRDGYGGRWSYDLYEIKVTITPPAPINNNNNNKQKIMYHDYNNDFNDFNKDESIYSNSIFGVIIIVVILCAVCMLYYNHNKNKYDKYIPINDDQQTTHLTAV